MSDPTADPNVDTEYDAELEEMKRRVAQMEAQMEAELAQSKNAGTTPEDAAATEAAQVAKLVAGGDADENQTEEEKEAVDSRSIYVGNVDYGATPEEIQGHFQSCGSINRVTILCDKFTGHPKGYAYVEFADPSYVDNANALNDSMFRGRLIKVVPKRTNIHGFNRGRGRGRGAYRGGIPRGGRGFHPYRARGRGRGRGY